MNEIQEIKPDGNGGVCETVLFYFCYAILFMLIASVFAVISITFLAISILGVAFGG